MCKLRHGYFWNQLPLLNSLELQAYNYYLHCNCLEELLYHFDDGDLIHHFDGDELVEEIDIGGKSNGG